jgi:hypothetical protein
MEFTTEELFEAIEKVVWEMLDRHGITEPPVDALALAQEEFDYTLREIEPDEEQDTTRRGRRREIVVRLDQTEESRQAAGARACAKELIPRVLARLGILPNPDQRPATSSLTGLIAPRILLPTRWFGKVSRKCGYDLLEVKDTFLTAGYEMIALRFLDLEEPCVISVVDDGIVSTRRSNAFPVTKKMVEAESRCQKKAQDENDAIRVRYDGWTACGWPIPNGPFGRIILRSWPDEI